MASSKAHFDLIQQQGTRLTESLNLAKNVSNAVIN